MRTEEGKRVKISFTCSAQDGTPRDLGVDNVLEFVIGLGKTLPSIEKGVLGMMPGEKKVVRVPTAEFQEFYLCEERAPAEPHPHRRNFGRAGDREREEVVVVLPPPARLAQDVRISAPDLYLLFEVTLMEVDGRR